MRRGRRWLLGGLALVLVLGGVLAYLVANLNRYLVENRPWLTAKAEEVLGRRVTFDRIEASVLGGFGVQIENLRVADDPAFSTGDLLRARMVTVRIKVLHALLGLYEVGRVSVTEPQITIVRRQEGLNIETLGQAPQGGGELSAGGGQTPARLASLLIVLLDVQGGELRLVDRTVDPPAETVLRALDVQASDLGLAVPLHLAVKAALLGSAERNLEVAGSIGPLGSPPAPLAAPVDLTLGLTAVDLDALRSQVPAVAAAMPAGGLFGGTLALQVHVQGTAGKLALEGTLDATKADIRQGTTFRKPAGVPLRVAFEGVRRGDTLALAPLTLRLADMELAGAGMLTAGTPPTVDFALDSQPTPLAGWDRLLPAFAGYEVAGTFESHLKVKGSLAPPALPSLTGTVTLAQVAAKKKGVPYEIDDLGGTMTFRGDAAELPPTRFRLGGAPVEVSVNIDSFARPSVRVVVKAAEIPARALGAAGEGVRTAEVLRGLDLRLDAHLAGDAAVVTGAVASSGGSLRDLSYDSLRATLGYQAGIATADDIDVRAYGGTYGGRLRVDARDPATPHFESRSTVRGMAVDQLAATYAPAAARALTGKLDADLTLAGAGTSWDTLERTLHGDGKAEVRDGVLRDVNLADQVLGGLTGMGGLATLVPPGVRQKYPGVFGTGETRFERLAGTVTVADGVAHLRDVVVAARDYTMRGAGTMTLGGEVDFAATLIASEGLTRDLTSSVKEARYLEDAQGRVSVPFRVAGTPPRLRAEPDAAAIAGALQRGLVEKGVEALVGGKGKKGSEHEELLRKGLEGLFRRR